MSSTAEKLASSLAALKELQDNGIIAINTSSLSRTHRERLIRNGFLLEVMKGWYIASKPDEKAGESTSWYASFWGFCADYLTTRFEEQWCLSPEQSISILTGSWTVPKQLLVRTPKGGNKPTNLLHDTSIFDLRLTLPAKEDLTKENRINIFRLESALIACPPSYYRAQPLDLRTALSMIKEPSVILSKLLDGGHSKVAGRLAGAFRNIGRDKIADTIISTMKAAGFSITETDPFDAPSPINFNSREVSPHVNRLKIMWSEFRLPIIDHFLIDSNKPNSVDKYLEKMEHIYTSDAYHSLSIEGYRVSKDLIERVQQGNWNPDSIQSDKDHINALAARGYWQAFNAVKQTIIDVLNGKDAAFAAEDDYDKWYRELFTPSVAAGIIKASDLAGYRNRPVFIKQSMHTPPNSDAVRDLMPAFFNLLQEENNPAVRVVLGHFIFVYIHPFIDGNGRTGRFLMNVMLAAAGLPWLVIPVEMRNQYMASLESASVERDIIPFTKLLSQLLAETISQD